MAIYHSDSLLGLIKAIIKHERMGEITQFPGIMFKLTPNSLRISWVAVRDGKAVDQAANFKWESVELGGDLNEG